MPKKILVAANFRVQLVTPYHAHMFEHPGFLQPTKLASVAVLDNASAATHCNGAAAKDAAKKNVSKLFQSFTQTCDGRSICLKILLVEALQSVLRRKGDYMRVYDLMITKFCFVYMITHG